MTCKIYDVRSYGAVGDGSTPDGDKIEKAISDLVAGGGGVLYFPPGRYLTHTKHFVRDVSLSIRGDGPSVSVIVWDAIDGGIEFNGRRSDKEVPDLIFPDHFRVEGLSLVTRRTLGGTALRMSWSGDGTGKSQFFSLKDLEIRGETQDLDPDPKRPRPPPLRQMWNIGISSQAAQGGSIQNVSVVGSRELSRSPVDFNNTTGISLHSISHSNSNGCYISHLTVYCYGTSLNLQVDTPNPGEDGGKIEGIYMSLFEFVSTRIGIRAVNGYGLHFSNGHIDYSQTGFSFYNTGDISIVGCATQHQEGDGLPGNAIELNNTFDGSSTLAGCVSCSIMGNRFYGPGSALHSNGIAIQEHNPNQASDSEMVIISANRFEQFRDHAVWLRGGTRKNKVSGNIFTNIHSGSPILDQGEENECVSNSEV